MIQLKSMRITGSRAIRPHFALIASLMLSLFVVHTSSVSVVAQKTSNETDQKWRIEEHKIGLLMSYYHHNQSEVAAGWQRTQEEVGRYMDCAYNVYKVRLKGEDISQDQYQSCEKQKQELAKRLSDLNKSLIGARKFIWEEEIDSKP